MSLFGEDIAAIEAQQQNELSLTAPAILSIFETSADQRNSFVDKIIEAVQEGVSDPLRVLVQLKSVEAVIGTLTDKNPKTNKRADVAKLFSTYTLEAAARQGKSFNVYGAKLEQKEVGANYDYSQCNDSELIALQAAADAAREKLKERQKYLQNLPASGIEVLDKETGEMVTIYKPSKSSTTTITVSLT